jgi:hypothetical protein
MKNRHKRDVNPTLSIQVLNFFFLSCPHHTAAICLLVTCVTARPPTELVNVSLRFHTHMSMSLYLANNFADSCI